MLPQDVCSLWNENNPLLDAGMDRSEPMNEWMNRSVYWIPKNRGWCSSKISREKRLDRSFLISQRWNSGKGRHWKCCNRSSCARLEVVVLHGVFNPTKSTIGRYAEIAPNTHYLQERRGNLQAARCNAKRDSSMTLKKADQSDGTISFVSCTQTLTCSLAHALLFIRMLIVNKGVIRLCFTDFLLLSSGSCKKPTRRCKRRQQDEKYDHDVAPG